MQVQWGLNQGHLDLESDILPLGNSTPHIHVKWQQNSDMKDKHLRDNCMSPAVRKPVIEFPTRYDTNWKVQLQKLARSLKFQIKVEEI